MRVLTASMQSDDFWKFTAKDFITALIAIFKTEVFGLNFGARPRVLIRMAIEIEEAATPKSKSHLHWTEIQKTENIAGKGEPRKSFTDFCRIRRGKRRSSRSQKRTVPSFTPRPPLMERASAHAICI
ncbi:MAG TPA: hypothetical protein VFQ91_13865 [Bryobacteraceae bacterium]|nr:hypothetical protein [Bryobacteraceae bacterium]